MFAKLRIFHSRWLLISYWKNWAWSLVRLILIMGLAFVIIHPILDRISTAIKPLSDLYSPIVAYIPQNFTIDNFRYAVIIMDYWRTLFNTVLLSGMTTALTVISCAFAGYGFARLKFKGSNLLFACVILTILVPPTTILIPIYLNLRYFSFMGLIPLITGSPVNILDTYWPFILTSLLANSYKAGLFIFIFRQFFRGIPKEIEESAYVDGAGVTSTFMRIMLPNSLPAIVTIVLFSFVWQWNDSFFTTTYLTTGSVMSLQLASLPYNLSIHMQSLMGGGTPDPFYLSMVQDTGVLLAMAPLIIMYLFAQRYFVEGVERTGVVG